MKLIFAYNATDNFWVKKIDVAHKIISPATYSCNLCKLTHGAFFEKELWANFKNTAVIDMEFLYKEAFFKRFPDFENTKLPVVLIESSSAPSFEFITANEFEGIASLPQLIQIIKQRLLEV